MSNLELAIDKASKWSRAEILLNSAIEVVLTQYGTHTKDAIILLLDILGFKPDMQALQNIKMEVDQPVAGVERATNTKQPSVFAIVKQALIDMGADECRIKPEYIITEVFDKMDIEEFEMNLCELFDIDFDFAPLFKNDTTVQDVVAFIESTQDVIAFIESTQNA